MCWNLEIISSGVSSSLSNYLHHILIVLSPSCAEILSTTRTAVHLLCIINSDRLLCWLNFFDKRGTSRCDCCFCNRHRFVQNKHLELKKRKRRVTKRYIQVESSAEKCIRSYSKRSVVEEKWPNQLEIVMIRSCGSCPSSEINSMTRLRKPSGHRNGSSGCPMRTRWDID